MGTLAPDPTPEQTVKSILLVFGFREIRNQAENRFVGFYNRGWIKEDTKKSFEKQMKKVLRDRFDIIPEIWYVSDKAFVEI